MSSDSKQKHTQQVVMLHLWKEVAWALKLTGWHTCKNGKNHSGEHSQITFYEWSGKYRLGSSFLEKNLNKLSHICIFCYDSIVLHEHWQLDHKSKNICFMFSSIIWEYKLVVVDRDVSLGEFKKLFLLFLSWQCSKASHVCLSLIPNEWEALY